MFSDELILPWLARLREQLPGLSLFDAHTHLGRSDPDGFRCEPEELLDSLERADARALVFPMHEPEGYRDANDWMIREAAGSGGRLVPLCRLDPAADPAAEARRALDAGAHGLKLHPRAEGFTLDHEALEGVWAIADERRLPVLVHAGRGIPALGRHALGVCERHPNLRLILAHAGISDLAWIWRAAPDHRNLLFDTSWWSPADLLALFALVPPGQILFGSDTPYGTPAFTGTMTLRCALQAGLDGDQARGVAGGQLERILAGERPVDLGPAPGPGSLPHDPLLERVSTFLAQALGQMFVGVAADEPLALAALACEVGDDAPQGEVCSSILSLLEAQRRYVPGPADRPSRFAPGLHLVVAAAAVARTPDVPLPPDLVPVDVAERSA